MGMGQGICRSVTGWGSLLVRRDGTVCRWDIGLGICRWDIWLGLCRVDMGQGICRWDVGLGVSAGGT